MSTTQMTTPEVEIDKIDIVDGFNSRRDFDTADLARLAETIKADGIVQPVDVRRVAPASCWPRRNRIHGRWRGIARNGPGGLGTS